MSKPVSIYLYTCGSGRFVHTLRYMSAYRAGMLCMVGSSIPRVLARRDLRTAEIVVRHWELAAKAAPHRLRGMLRANACTGTWA